MLSHKVGHLLHDGLLCFACSIDLGFQLLSHSLHSILRKLLGLQAVALLLRQTQRYHHPCSICHSAHITVSTGSFPHLPIYSGTPDDSLTDHPDEASFKTTFFSFWNLPLHIPLWMNPQPKKRRPPPPLKDISSMWLWLGRPDTAAHSARVSSPCFTVQPDTASGHHAAEAVGNHWGPQRAAHCSCSQPLRTSEGTTLLRRPQRAVPSLWGTTEDLRGQYHTEDLREAPQRAVPCRRSCEEPLRTSEGSTLQKKLWGTTEDLRGQYPAEEAVRNHWGPQRAVPSRRSCEEPLRTSEGSTQQKKLWGTTEDLRGQYPAEEAVRNHWGPQRAVPSRRSCEEPLRTSEGSTLQKKLWGTTEDLRGQYPAAEEAVRNHWGPQRAVPCRRSCEEPLRTSEGRSCGDHCRRSCEEPLRTSEGRTLQKKLWGTTEDFRGQHTVLINREEPPMTCTGCSGSQHQQVSSSDNIAIKRLNRWLDFSMVVSKKRFHWSRNSSSFPTRHNTSSDMSQHPALPAAFRGRPEAAARTAAPARCSPAVLLAVIPPGTVFPSAAPHPCAGFPTGRPQWPASQQQVKISAEYI